MRESEKKKGKDILKTKDENEAKRKWGQLLNEGTAESYGFKNGIYTVEGARN